MAGNLERKHGPRILLVEDQPQVRSVIICALEAEVLEEFKYGSSGQACLDNSVNQQAQPVYRDKVEIDNLRVGPDDATAQVEANASTSDVVQIYLSLIDDKWVVDDLQ